MDGGEGLPRLRRPEGGEVHTHTVCCLERLKRSIGNGMRIYPLTHHQHLSVGTGTGQLGTRQQHNSEVQGGHSVQYLGAADGVPLPTLTRRQQCVQLLLLTSQLTRDPLIPEHQRETCMHNTARQGVTRLVAVGESTWDTPYSLSRHSGGSHVTEFHF